MSYFLLLIIISRNKTSPIEVKFTELELKNCKLNLKDIMKKLFQDRHNNELLNQHKKTLESQLQKIVALHQV